MDTESMRRSLAIGGLAGTNILLGFLYQWYTVTVLGPGTETDALIAGMMVPQLVLAVVGGSVSQVLVPLLANLDEEGFRRASWSFFLSAGLLFTGVGAALFGLASFWVPFVVPGFQHEAAALATSLTRIQLVGMVFSVLSAVLWSVARARERFIRAEVAALLASLLVFGLLVWSLPRLGVAAAAWALALRMVLQTLFLFPELGPYVRPSFRDEVMLEAGRRFKPLLIGTSYYKTDPFVDRALASLAPSGGMTLLHLAQQLYGAGNTLLSRAMVVPMVSTQAKRFFNDDRQNFDRTYRRYLLVAGAITLGGFAFLVLLGQPVLTLFFGHNRFDAESIRSLWWLLLLLGGLWVGGGLGAITSSTYYARGDTVTPTRLGIRTFNVYLPLKVGVFFFCGLKGLAVSISCFYLVNFALQFHYLNKKEGC